MKPTHLITLSELVTELNENLLSGIDQSKELELIKNWNNKLKGIVTLAHFVACDANGVPFRKSKGKNPKRSIWKPYNEAQKSVIFEGWEVSQNKKDDFFIYVFNKELDIEIEFDTNDGEIEILLEVSKRSFFAPEPIKSLADLAAATTKKPLKLK